MAVFPRHIYGAHLQGTLSKLILSVTWRGTPIVSHMARTVQVIVSVSFGSIMMSIAALIIKDDPIVLDATTMVPSHTTNVIDTVSNSRQQKECGTRGEQ